MGTSGSIVRVAASEMDHLRESPDAVEELLFPPGRTPPLVEVREKGTIGWLLRLIGVQITQVDPDWVPPEGWDRQDDRGVDLDKAWHGLHYIFTRTAWEGEPPGCFLIEGGEEIGDEDDESRPRLLDPNRVRQFSEFLASISDEEFTRRFDAERMTALRIYPEIWNRDHDHPAPLEYLRSAFHDLRTFVAIAADHGEALVVHVG